jgi:hypothetical protein
MPKTARTLTDAQRAYETKRAAKAGMSLDKWLAEKQKQANRAQKLAEVAKKPAKPPGFFSRLLDRAHKPL